MASLNHDLSRAGYFLGGNGHNPMRIAAIAMRGNPASLQSEFGSANRIPASTRRMGRGYHGSMKVAPVAKASAAAPVRTLSVRHSQTMKLEM